MIRFVNEEGLKIILKQIKNNIDSSTGAVKSFSRVTNGTSTAEATSANETLNVTGGGDVSVSVDNSSKKVSISLTKGKGNLKIYTGDNSGSNTVASFNADQTSDSTLSVKGTGGVVVSGDSSSTGVITIKGGSSSSDDAKKVLQGDGSWTSSPDVTATKVSNKLTFSGGAKNVTYDGSSAITVDADTIGAVKTADLFVQQGDTTDSKNELGKIRAKYLPGYVDDVIEGYCDTSTTKHQFYMGRAKNAQDKIIYTTPITGEAGKIYVDLDTGDCYRYVGTGGFVLISDSTAALSQEVETKNVTIEKNGQKYTIKQGGTALNPTIDIPNGFSKIGGCSATQAADTLNIKDGNGVQISASSKQITISATATGTGGEVVLSRNSTTNLFEISSKKAALSASSTGAVLSTDSNTSVLVRFSDDFSFDAVNNGSTVSTVNDVLHVNAIPLGTVSSNSTEASIYGMLKGAGYAVK